MREKIYTVSELNESIDAFLKETYAYPVKVQGEVVDFRITHQKWVYFSLKDDKARLPCFLALERLDVDLKDGLEIRVLGRPGLFVPYGKFTFRVWEIELVGEGALKKALEKLKLRLEKEGLFDLERKRPIPRFPRRIGLITSLKAAAYNDFIRIVNNRWSGVEIYVAPVQVQGKEAIGQIVSALEFFNNLEKKMDVLVLTRGGGSLEDLQAFNSERVVRAIFASKIPVVCGIGHERDWTLADLVADKRASTPSNAAEIVVPSRDEINYQFDVLIKRIESKWEDYLSEVDAQIQERVLSLESILDSQIEDLMIIVKRVRQAFQITIEKMSFLVDSFRSKITALRMAFDYWFRNLEKEIEDKEKIIKTLSPSAILKRGYSIVFRIKNGKIITKAKEVKLNDDLNIKLSQGELNSRVTKIKKH